VQILRPRLIVGRLLLCTHVAKVLRKSALYSLNMVSYYHVADESHCMNTNRSLLIKNPDKNVMLYSIFIIFKLNEVTSMLNIRTTVLYFDRCECWSYYQSGVTSGMKYSASIDLTWWNIPLWDSGLGCKEEGTTVMFPNWASTDTPHRRRNRGGSGGSCPPQTIGRGGTAPTRWSYDLIKKNNLHCIISISLIQTL